MRIGICPGSFDPVTNGHVDVFERSAKLVDKLIIAIFANPGKHPLFSMEEREELLRQAVGHIPNVEVVSFQGLLNEYAVERGATVIIRGLRAVTDFEYEFQAVGTDFGNRIYYVEYELFVSQLFGHTGARLFRRQTGRSRPGFHG